MEINYWKNPMTVNEPTETTTIDVFLERVKNGFWKHEVEKVRSEQNNEKRKALNYQKLLAMMEKWLRISKLKKMRKRIKAVKKSEEWKKDVKMA